jgi:hypothetical protein
MSTLSLRIPNSLHRELRELAEREGVSINQIISAAVGEKVASLKTLDYLRERARQGSRQEFDRLSHKRLPPAKARRRFAKKQPRPTRLRG